MTVHAYQAVKRVSTVEGSSPHELICILYDAALSQIAMAQQHIDHKNYQHLFLCADKAVAIVQELQGSLKDYRTNEIAGNLFELYTFIIKTLIESKTSSNKEGFATCTELLEILKDSWQSIATEKMAA